MIRFLTMMMAALGLFAAAPASAAAPAPPVSAENGVAIRGYDPVAFFTLGRPQEGSAEHAFVYEGALWRFASAENLATFKNDPARYAPQFGGYCAWAVSQHYLAPGDPKYWKVVEGKLYLNANARAKELWEAEQAEAIERGHANWPAVLTQNQEARR
jgi:YHS domain-containing protein